MQYNFDSAGRPTSVQNLNTGISYASQLQYTAPGDVKNMNTNNGLNQQFTWNDRLQMVSTSAGTTPGSYLQLGFLPCANGTSTCATNNGNIQLQTAWTPNMSATQNYIYDANNRLKSAQESETISGRGGPGWKQVFGYDTVGNRYLSVPDSWGLGAPYAGTPQGLNWFASGSNRASDPAQPWGYDLAGNLIGIPALGQTFVYDAENREVSYSVGGLNTIYQYDGEGQRVVKTGGGQTTVYVYDAFGNLAGEYGPGVGNPCGATSTCYYTQDNLGSVRMLTDANGQNVRHYDYLPFGEDLFAGTGGRTTGMGYLPTLDFTNPRFTGQMRDGESGFDFFHARYYGSYQGRFTSADPGNAGADAGDPQSWNGYAYVSNNPLTSTDPSGLGLFGDILGAIGAGIGFFACGPPCAVQGFAIGDVFGSVADVGRTGDITQFSPATLSMGLAPGAYGLDPRFGGLNGLIWGNRQSPFILSAQPGQKICGDFYCDAAGNPSMSAPLPASRIAIDDPGANLMLGAAGIGAANGALAIGQATRTAITAGTHPMEVAIGSGDLATSPFHVMFKVGGEWMHANGPKLFTRMIFMRSGAARLAGEATRRFTVPILYPTAVKALEGSHAWSCATGAIRAFWTGWFGGC